MKSKHLLSLKDLGAEGLEDVLQLAARFKKDRGTRMASRPLTGKSVALIFSKSSTRTRVSFEVGIYELGGHSMFFDKNDLQLGRGESMSDTAKVLSRYVHAVVIRYHDHEAVVELASHATVPVINALTDKYHPCQLLADLQTIREYHPNLRGVKVAFMGDADNNMAHSWMIAAMLSGIELRLGAPERYQPHPDFLATLSGPGKVTITGDPAAAVKDADYVYTDVWVSMGFEEETQEREKELRPYQVNAELLRRAAPKVKVMHCLPAYRGKEITAEVLDGPQSIIWDQAENRLHAQKAVLARLIG